MTRHMCSSQISILVQGGLVNKIQDEGHREQRFYKSDRSSIKLKAISNACFANNTNLFPKLGHTIVLQAAMDAGIL